MPKSPEELRRIWVEDVFASYLEQAGLTDEDVTNFCSRAIPMEWARAVAADTKGRIRLEDWPHVIHPPRLQRHDTDDTLRPVDVNTADAPVAVKQGAGRATRKSKAQKKLYEAKKTISSVALELREGRPRVSAWFAAGEAQRPVPERHRKYFARLGITEDDGIRFAD